MIHFRAPFWILFLSWSAFWHQSESLRLEPLWHLVFLAELAACILPPLQPTISQLFHLEGTHLRGIGQTPSILARVHRQRNPIQVRELVQEWETHRTLFACHGKWEFVC